MHRFEFQIAATDGAARTGTITMQRGEIRTPAFMPVGTAATVKAMRPETCARRRRHHARQHLSPDAAPRRGAGGAARRAARVHGLGAADPDRQRRLPGDEPQRADQSHARRGCRFASHLDGSRHMLSPERSMEIQRLLGSDIVMAFDELVPTTVARD